MADYFKLMLGAIYSANSDYSDPKFNLNVANYTTSPTEVLGPITVSAGTSATTVPTASGFLSTAALMVVKNKDTTNYVQVAWTDVSTTACVARVLAGGILVVSDMNPGTSPTLTANTAAVLCDVLIVQHA